MHKKNILLVLALVAVLLVVVGVATACGSSNETTTTTAAAADKPVDGGTLAVYIGDPSFIDPANAFESEGIKVVDSLYDSLTGVDYKTMKVVPAAADSWEANADATVWTFHLHPGATFSDGTPVTAADFKYAWERIVSPAQKSEIAYQFSMIKGYDEMQAGTATELTGVKAVDANTLEVTLNYGFGDFPTVFSHPSFGPVPKAAVEKDPKAFALSPVGNGPFKMAEPWAAGQYVKVVRNDSYYGTKPHVAGIDFRIFKDLETAFLEFKAGTLDWTQIPSGQYKATADQYGISDNGYTANPGKQVQNGGELAIYYITINNTDPLFKNADLRKAVTLAINRQAICDTVYEGIRKPASSFVPIGIDGYEENAWPDSHYDVEAAKAALAAAGYPNGQGLPTIKLSFNSGAGHEDVMALVQADLKAIGINTEFDTSDAPTFWDKLGKGNYQIARCGWQADYPLIDNFVNPEFQSESGDNYSKYANPAVDSGVLAARATVDPAARMKAYQDLVKLIGSTNPVVPVDTYAHHNVASARVHELTYSSHGLLDYINVWISAQ
jgi:oligopeptide transport system substrate-binding protein